MEESGHNENGGKRRFTLNGELPWFAFLKVPLSQLAIIGSLIVAVTGTYLRVQAHSEEIAAIKATMQTREMADVNAKVIVIKLDEMKERLDKIEGQQQAIRDRQDQISDRQQQLLLRVGRSPKPASQ